MGEKIRIICEDCGKQLACPATAAGKKIRCPKCETTIRVPKEQATVKTKSRPKTAAKKRAKPVSPEEDYDDPYRDTVPRKSSGKPPRAKNQKSSGRKNTKKPSAKNVHWSKRTMIGFGIMGAAVASNAVQLAVMGPPNMKTAQGQGQAFGQGLVTVGGIIFGLVIVVRGLMANRSKK